MVRCASSSTPSPSSSAAEAGQQVAKVHSYGTVDYERRTAPRWSSLYRRIAVGHGNLPVGRTLGAWDEGERRLDKWELCRIPRELRKFRRFNLALQGIIIMTKPFGRAYQDLYPHFKTVLVNIRKLALLLMLQRWATLQNLSTIVAPPTFMHKMSSMIMTTRVRLIPCSLPVRIFHPIKSYHTTTTIQ